MIVIIVSCNNCCIYCCLVFVFLYISAGCTTICPAGIIKIHWTAQTLKNTRKVLTIDHTLKYVLPDSMKYVANGLNCTKKKHYDKKIWLEFRISKKLCLFFFFFRFNSNIYFSSDSTNRPMSLLAFRFLCLIETITETHQKEYTYFVKQVAKLENLTSGIYIERELKEKSEF